jgi:Tol biopolymer transport system component
MKRSKLFILMLSLILFACSKKEFSIQINEYPSIYPDYTDICIPYNIAPLNFMIRENCKKITVEIVGKNDKLIADGINKVSFPLDKFSNLLAQNRGDTLLVTVTAKINDKLLKYKTFRWIVVSEPIDSYLTYRLIEPGYEVWSKISISQRNITNFDETPLADNNLTEGSCMNCHIGSKQNPQKSFFHLRGPKGGTVIVDGKNLRKINTKPEGAYSNAIYGNWHPSGRFIGFSTNVVLPAMHTIHDKRVLVYDTKSDLIVLDLATNEIITSPLISRKDRFETFPEFSADGKRMFYCVSDSVNLPEDYKSLHYNLCSIEFNQKDRTFGSKIDTLINARRILKTVSEPKVSPDGKYLMYTFFNYGTFPIWHAEAKLYCYHLATGQIDSMPELNNNNKYSNSYHCWSSNSKWVVFASKRDNGMYGKPYFSYIDNNGKAHKPFVLPQKDAEFYDYTYKSFNIPELFEQARSFNAFDIEKLYKNNSPAEQVRYLSK